MNMEKRAESMAAAVATAHDVDDPRAGRRLALEVRRALDGCSADWGILFASAHFEPRLSEIAAEVHERLELRALVGTTAEWTIGGAVEFESRPALVLWAAHMPGVRVGSFHVCQEDLLRLDTPGAWHDYLGVQPREQPNFVVLSDPFTVSTPGLLERLRQAYPRRPAVGGLASSGEEPGQNVLIFDGHTLRQGACGVWLAGNLTMDTIVSQGCRPIGRHMVITDGKRNVIRGLGGRPPLAVVIETLQECSEEDLSLIQTGDLLVGRVINEYQPHFARGDFLIRYPVGFERESGAMLINDVIRTGQTIQFHVRDRAAADDDLATLLAARPRTDAVGTLLFTCNGRGTRLFVGASHDARAVSAATRGRPLAGMCCAGEVGPIGHTSYVHGQTAVAAFFRPPAPAIENPVDEDAR